LNWEKVEWTAEELPDTGHRMYVCMVGLLCYFVHSESICRQCKDGAHQY